MPTRVLNWEKARHSVGIPAIDEQHRRIVAEINALHQAAAKEIPHDAVRQLLGNLIQAIDRHFAYEERLMQSHSFPDMETHKAEHREIVEHATHLFNALTPARPLRTELALAYLTDWTERHVLEADKWLGVFLAARGLGNTDGDIGRRVSEE
ncbi:MAG: bacteriohemerythrin [Betaproteobacteria bacterium]|nr:bacteriohemerythrin [Betaproteobacteria bacterium]